MQSALLKPHPQRQSFATPEDFEYCRSLHRKFGTTYYFASRHLPPHHKRQVDALYGFVRVPDEWVDNPGDTSPQETARLLREYRSQLAAAHQGHVPANPALRAFADVMVETGMTLDEPMIFLDAMEMDLTVSRYQTWDDLMGYIRGSASAVGIMMAHILKVEMTPQATTSAMALGNGMQLANFLRDIAEDLERGRVYMPLDDLASFGLTVEDLERREVTPAFRSFMEFEIARAREEFAKSDPGIELIPASSRLGVKLGRILYSRILDKIEEADYDVFRCRAHTTQWEKAATALRVAATDWMGMR